MNGYRCWRWSRTPASSPSYLNRYPKPRMVLSIWGFLGFFSIFFRRLLIWVSIIRSVAPLVFPQTAEAIWARLRTVFEWLMKNSSNLYSIGLRLNRLVPLATWNLFKSIFKSPTVKFVVAWPWRLICRRSLETVWDLNWVLVYFCKKGNCYA